MEFGICLQGVVPVRSEPSHKSEMVTQILFGELYRIMAKEGIWYRVQLVYDHYEGWVHHLQVNAISEVEFLRLGHAVTPVSMDLVQLVSRISQQDLLPVVLGSSLPGLNDNIVSVDKDSYEYDGSVSQPATFQSLKSEAERDEFRRKLAHDAMLYLNAPYLWGGRTPIGIDCSGFIQMAYKLHHIQLLRDAGQQATQGEVISLLFEAHPADLVFFDDEEGNINHVGMLINRSLAIHCSGQVRIDPIDQEGIFNADLKRYTHKLRLIRRII